MTTGPAAIRGPVPRTLVCAGVLSVVGMILWSPARAQGQILRGGAEPMPEAVDSSGVLARAHREQSRFERRRVRLLPVSWQGRGGDCDEVVGRFCAWFDGDEDRLPEEPGGVREARDALLAYLDSVQTLLPTDGWVTGQRVWYRGESRRWDLALDAARTMGLNMCGVDILRSKNGPVVMEVNSSPGLEGIESATGKNVAGMIFEYLERAARPNATRTVGKG